MASAPSARPASFPPVFDTRSCLPIAPSFSPKSRGLSARCAGFGSSWTGGEVNGVVGPVGCATIAGSPLGIGVNRPVRSWAPCQPSRACHFCSAEPWRWDHPGIPPGHMSRPPLSGLNYTRLLFQRDPEPSFASECPRSLPSGEGDTRVQPQRGWSGLIAGPHKGWRRGLGLAILRLKNGFPIRPDAP